MKLTPIVGLISVSTCGENVDKMSICTREIMLCFNLEYIFEITSSKNIYLKLANILHNRLVYFLINGLLHCARNSSYSNCTFFIRKIFVRK